jgi:hypothetical protein
VPFSYCLKNIELFQSFFGFEKGILLLTLGPPKYDICAPKAPVYSPKFSSKRFKSALASPVKD